MKYHKINIHTDDTQEMYNTISTILNIHPTEFEEDNENWEDRYSVWIYQIETTDEESFDFINTFLDILEPNFSKLAEAGIEKEAISLWYLYEYDQQCSMEFNPQELKRLGESGIALCIDCRTAI